MSTYRSHGEPGLSPGPVHTWLLPPPFSWSVVAYLHARASLAVSPAREAETSGTCDVRAIVAESLGTPKTRMLATLFLTVP